MLIIKKKLAFWTMRPYCYKHAKSQNAENLYRSFDIH